MDTRKGYAKAMALALNKKKITATASPNRLDAIRKSNLSSAQRCNRPFTKLSELLPEDHVKITPE